jgi:Lon protease-like protein
MRIPVFPLGLVLMPRMPLPLHIFEERYRRMVNDCLETDLPFGVLLHTGTTIQTVGCMARIESVINRYDDGRMDILTVGTERFKVSAMHELKVYLEADVDILRDEPLPENSGDTISELSEAAMADLAEFARVAGYEVDRQILKDLRPEELSFLLATTDVFSTEEKQQLIELRSTPERMRRATRALDAGRERRAMTNRIREIIGEKSENIDHLFN